MAEKPQSESRVVPSLLDRLTHDGDSTVREPSILQSRRDWEASLLRDVQALLNTKRAAEEVPPEFKLLSESVLNYGLPDFVGMSLKSPTDQVKLRTAIETALAVFEPRLASVRVEMEKPSSTQPALRFHVSALMRIYPGVEPIRFDTLLQGDTNQILVVEEGR